MYDTNFFINTYNLKKHIIGKNPSTNDKETIFKSLENHRIKKPFVFNIETTSACNMKCTFCQRPNDFKRKVEHMSMDTFKNLVKQMFPQTENDKKKWQKFVDTNLREDKNPSENNYYFDIIYRCVTLHGFGEPLLDPLLPERISILTEKNIPTYFSSNPCNIKLDFIQKLFDAGTGFIKFAIDSLDDNEAKRLRGGKADFTNSYKNILDVLDLKKETKAKTTIVVTMLDSSGDINQLNKFIELWKDKDVYVYAKSIDNQWLLQNKKESETELPKNKSHYKKQYCEFPWTSVTVLADGSVVPCTQDINGIWTFGNINKNSLEEIWNSKKYNDFRQLHLTNDFDKNFMCHSKCDLDLISYYYKDNK